MQNRQATLAYRAKAGNRRDGHFQRPHRLMLIIEKSMRISADTVILLSFSPAIKNIFLEIWSFPF